MKAGIAAVALVGMLGSGLAASAQFDGNELLGQCKSAIRLIDNARKSSDSDFDSGMCFGKVSGVRFMMNESAEDGACFPEGGISNAQAARVVIKYLGDNPESLHKDGRYLIVLALHKAFPCK